MNLKYLVQKRIPYPQEIEEQLIEILTKGLRKSDRRLLVKLIREKFLTILSDVPADWSRFSWDGMNLSYAPKAVASFNAEIKAVRELILKHFEDKLDV